MDNSHKNDFRRKLLSTEDKSALSLKRAVGIETDYSDDVPWLRYPVPAAGSGEAHPIAIRYSSPLNASSVDEDTVLIYRPRQDVVVDADVSLSDPNTIEVRPRGRLNVGDTDDLLHIIVTPGVTTADGRSLAGIAFVVSAG